MVLKIFLLFSFFQNDIPFNDSVRIRLSKPEIQIKVRKYSKSTISLDLINESRNNFTFFYDFKDIKIGSFIDEETYCNSDSIPSILVLILRDSNGNIVAPKIPSYDKKAKRATVQPIEYFKLNEFTMAPDSQRHCTLQIDFLENFNLYKGEYEFVILFNSGIPTINLGRNTGTINIFHGCIISNKIKLIIR